MITVHHLNNSRSQRILWLLEELELEYVIKRYERDPQTMLAPASLRAIHPLGKSPVITDGDLVVAESGAIIEYLVEKYGHGRLIPALDTPERLRYTYWLHYAEGSLMPQLLLKLAFERVEHTQMPFFIAPVAKIIASQARSTHIEPEIAMHLDYLEAEIQQETWFAGEEFTAADIQMSFPLEAAVAQTNLGTSHRSIVKFLERIHSRQAYQRALDRGGSYNLSFS